MKKLYGAYVLNFSLLSVASSHQFKISLPGSYEKQLCIPCKTDSGQNQGIPFVFHVGKDMCSELDVELEQTITIIQVRRGRAFRFGMLQTGRHCEYTGIPQYSWGIGSCAPYGYLKPWIRGKLS